MAEQKDIGKAVAEALGVIKQTGELASLAGCRDLVVSAATLNVVADALEQMGQTDAAKAYKKVAASYQTLLNRYAEKMENDPDAFIDSASKKKE